MAVAEEAAAAAMAGEGGDTGPAEKDVRRHPSPWFLGATCSGRALAGPRLPHGHRQAGKGAVPVAEGLGVSCRDEGGFTGHADEPGL